MPPRKKKPSLLPVVVEKKDDDDTKEEEEEEDRHAVEMLRRLEDLGVDLPSTSMAPETLRNHKRDPLGFVAIASQLATLIEPLIEMTGADNPTLARRSCETIRTLGPGTSEEDRASRALGALAVLAVGQMYCIQFSNLEKRLVVVVVRFSSSRLREGKPRRVWSFFSSRRHRYRQKSRPRSVRRVFSPIDYHDSSPLFSNCFLHKTMLDERFRDKIGTFRVFEILVAYIHAARLMQESMEKQQQQKQQQQQQQQKETTTVIGQKSMHDAFRELERASGEKGEKGSTKEIALGAKEVAETFEMNAKGKGVSEKHRGRVVERNEFERMSEEELGIAREANEALKTEFKKRKEMIAKRAGVSVQSLTKSSISTINTNNSNSQNQGTKRSRKMEDLDSDKYESDAFSLACDAGNGDDATEIIFPDSLFDLRGADVAKAGLKAGSGRSRQKVRLIGEDGFDAKTVTIGEVPDRGGRVDESGRFVAKFKGGNKGGSKGETGAATGNNNKRQWRKRK